MAAAMPKEAATAFVKKLKFGCPVICLYNFNVCHRIELT